MRRVLGAIILVCGLHVVISLAWAAGQQAPPIAYFSPTPVVLRDSPCALQCDRPDFDVGSLPQGRELDHTFTVVNRSAAPLVIDRAESSCGCTLAEISQHRLAAGESATVKVHFTAGSLVGPFNKSVRVFVSPPGTVLLSVRGHILTDYLPDPAALTFGDLEVGKTVRRSIVYSPTRAEARWTYGAPYTMDSEVALTGPVEQPDGSYRLELAFTPRRAGARAGVVTLPGKAPLFVRYSARVSP